jgi:hypothetical protein
MLVWCQLPCSTTNSMVRRWKIHPPPSVRSAQIYMSPPWIPWWIHVPPLVRSPATYSILPSRHGFWAMASFRIDKHVRSCRLVYILQSITSYLQRRQFIHTDLGNIVHGGWYRRILSLSTTLWSMWTAPRIDKTRWVLLRSCALLFKQHPLTYRLVDWSMGILEISSTRDDIDGISSLVSTTFLLFLLLFGVRCGSTRAYECFSMRTSYYVSYIRWVKQISTHDLTRYQKYSKNPSRDTANIVGAQKTIVTRSTC